MTKRVPSSVDRRSRWISKRIGESKFVASVAGDRQLLAKPPHFTKKKTSRTHGRPG